MIKIFIEAKNASTPEYNFLKTLLADVSCASDCEIVPLGGKDKLHLAKNQFIQNTSEGGINAIIFDADGPTNGGGFAKRKEEIESQLNALGIQAMLFLWPDNMHDGDFETMLEGIARTDLHQRFFDCFRDYELCLGDAYLTPNRKGKLHTYVSSMHLNKKSRDKIGSGHWLFDDPELWNLHSGLLAPLKRFIMSARSIANP